MNKPLDVLRKSPLFNLSLSSKELFHSNFLWWLGSNERTFPLFKQAMEKFVGKTLQWTFDAICVEREKKHFDLCVKNKVDQRALLILENKVKSIPTQKQLDGYCNDKLKAENYVLLSLATEFPDKAVIKEENIWKICNYADLAKVLETIPDGLTPYERELINDYRTFILSLHKLAQQWISEVTPDSPFITERPDKVEECRLHDLYDKLRFSQLALMLQEQLSGTDVSVGMSYSNQTGILDVTIRYEDHRLMIQVQGNSYRHACVWNDKERKECDSLWKHILKEDKVVRETNFLGKKINFGSDELFKEGVYPKKEKPYNAFVGKNNVFLYQSRQLRPNTTIGKLFENICNEVRNIGEKTVK